ncbi:hypothetical protein ACPBEI_00940 [Latilactobacillus sakei]
MTEYQGIIYYKHNGTNVFMNAVKATDIISLFCFDKKQVAKLNERWPLSKNNIYMLFEGKEIKLESE